MSEDNASQDKGAQEKGERIAKRMARAGLCSRRDAERWIAEGRVAVNGKRLDSPAVVVDDGDIVTVDGKPVAAPERTRLFRYHKPAGLVTSHKDPQGRPTVFDELPEGLPRLISVGRLDLNSEGLLLLTNDGELARKLELPATGWIRRYRVRVFGQVDPEKLAELEKGITVDGVSYGSIHATLDHQRPSNAWLTVSLREGKNREIRRVMDFLGWRVTRLIRVSYGPFLLGALEPGMVEEVPPRVLREQIGLGADKTPEQKRAERLAREKAAQPETPAKKVRPSTPSAKRALKLIEESETKGRRDRHKDRAKSSSPGGKPHANRRRPS